MLTLFLKASIGLFISDLKRTEAISDLFPLLAEIFESERWQRLQNSHIKEEWITESFLSAILSVTLYVMLSTSASRTKSNSQAFPSGPWVRALPRAECRGWG